MKENQSLCIPTNQKANAMSNNNAKCNSIIENKNEDKNIYCDCKIKDDRLLQAKM